MATQGLIQGTKDYGISENKYLQILFPWLSQIDNPKVYAADNTGQIGPAGYPIPGTFQKDGGASGGTTGTTGGTGGGQPTGFQPTGNQGGYGTSAASDEAARREAEARAAIEAGYGGYLSGMEGLKSMYETGREEELSSAAKTYESIFGGLGEQKSANLAKIQAGREAVGTRRAQSIKDLQQNLANTLRGATMQFGAMGAGDTSATRTMLPYAYTKLAGAQEGCLLVPNFRCLFYSGDIRKGEVVVYNWSIFSDYLQRMSFRYWEIYTR